MKHWLSQTITVAITAITVLNVATTFAADRFSVAIANQDQLVLTGANGEKLAEFNPPALSQAVKSGSTSFQVSYGRDANDQWTVILAPNPIQASPLSFSVLDSKVDADKTSVVTLIYSKDLRRVTIDPGYVGSVKLNDSPISGAVAIGAGPALPAVAANAPAQEMTPRIDTSSPDVAAAVNTPAKIPAIPTLNPKKAYWSEPVTPPNPRDLPPVASNEIKLLEVRGAVSVVLPNSSEVPASNGMTIPSGTTIKTGSDGSAAAFMGGVNSARFLPNSTGTINQVVMADKRDTLIDLKDGVVFANVGRKAGETQDFKVKSPAGVAAAKGTAYVVKAEGSHLFVATLVGSVVVTDPSGNFIGNSNPVGIGQPGIVTVGDSGVTGDATLAALIVAVQSFNSKINGLEAKVPNLTPEERSYLDRAPKLAQNYAEELNQDIAQNNARRGGNGGPDLGGAAGGIAPTMGGFGSGWDSNGGVTNFNPNAQIPSTTPH